MLCECFFDKKTDGNTLYFYFKMLSAKPEERSKLITSWRYPHPKKKIRVERVCQNHRTQ